MESVRLDGQVMIVTGAGAGIGRGEAVELALRGAAIVVNDRAADRADEVVKEIHDAGGSALADYSSVSDPEVGERLLAACLDTFGRIDGLVSNAGFLRPDPFAELTAERIDAVLDVHLRGVFSLVQPLWRHMSDQRYGRIVLTGSSGGMFGVPGSSNYCAAKAGNYGLMKGLAFEGSEYGIKVNCLLPYAATSIRTDGDPGMTRYSELAAAEARRFETATLPTEERAWRADAAMVAPLVTYLVSPGCEPNGEAFSACLGRFARVFVGVADGWLAGTPGEVTTESIVEHMAEIRGVDRHSVPLWTFDYMAAVTARIAALTSGGE